MSDPTKYNNYGRMMTGFRSGIEQSTFGHWRNPEYIEILQSEEQQPEYSGFWSNKNLASLQDKMEKIERIK